MSNQLADSDIRGRSHWLQQALAVEADLAAPLEGETKADVCIVGGGYLGLWTAIRLREADPGIDVVVLERDICGGGPSGRNSGMLLSAWTKLAALAALRNEAEALRIVDLSVAAIDDIEQFCAENGIDCWFDRVGWIWGATCQAQNGAWNGALARYAQKGRQPARRRLTRRNRCNDRLDRLPVRSLRLVRCHRASGLPRSWPSSRGAGAWGSHI